MTAAIHPLQRGKIMRKNGITPGKWMCVLFTTLLLALAAGCAAGTTAKSAPRSSEKRAPALKPAPKLQHIATLHLGFEKRGVEFEEVAEMDVIPAIAELAVRSGRTTRIVRDFMELVGLVHITSPEKALKYARLWARAGRGGYRFFGGAVEIVDVNRFLHMRDTDGKPSELPPAWHGGFQSGLEGILSEAAYHASPFTPPRVERSPEGFTITRWVFQNGRPDRVMRIREVVGTDGSYQRVVCKQMPPPKLPHTMWGVVGIE